MKLTHEAQNINNPERWISLAAGAAMAVYGLRRKSAPGLTLAGLGGALLLRGATGHCLGYRLLGISTARDAHRHPGNVSVPYGHGIGVEKSVTIDEPPEVLFAFWRDFENLPRFMSHLESVRVIDDKRSHWKAKGPAGTNVEWDAEIIHEEPNALIGWRSVEGSDVDNAGSVHFTPATGGLGTELKVILRYDPPAGRLGAAVAKIFAEDPARQVEEDLRKLKQILEAGGA